MIIENYELTFKKQKEDFEAKNITTEIQKLLSNSKINNGFAIIFVVGSTAAISTMEFESNLIKDIENALERLTPSNIEYEHYYNGKSHIRATFIGPSLTVPIKNKKLVLGSWQQIVLLDFDIPRRERKLFVQICGL